jgi:hypothetical protein
MTEREQAAKREIHDAASDVLYWFTRAGTGPKDLEEQEAALQCLSLAVSECEALDWHKIGDHERQG